MRNYLDEHPAASDVQEIEEDVKQDYRDTEPGNDTQDKLDALDDLLDDPEVRWHSSKRWGSRRPRYPFRILCIWAVDGLIRVVLRYPRTQ